MSVGWSSRHGGSVVMRHEWKGLLKMQGALEDLVEKQRLESQERSTNWSGGVQDDTDSENVYMSESEEEDDE
jgi:DDB1- and CUL4-associated factor 11